MQICCLNRSATAQHIQLSLTPFIFISLLVIKILKMERESRENIQEQTLTALNNLEAVLDTLGCNRNNIVKTSVFLKNFADFPKMNAAYADFFCHTEIQKQRNLQKTETEKLSTSSASSASSFCEKVTALKRDISAKSFPRIGILLS